MSNFRLITKNNIPFLSLLPFEKFTFLKHAFSLKLSGHLQPLKNSPVTEIYNKTRTSEQDFLKAVGIPKEDLITLNQVHESQCRKVYKSQAISIKGSDGDGLITADEGIALGVRTADCFPVLMLDYEKKVISSTHVGWRGLSKRILENCLDLMTKEFACQPESILAAIGPGIKKCCYTVQRDVIEDLKKKQVLIQKCVSREKDHSFNLDLEGIIKEQLTGKGLPKDKIYHTPYCTSCSALPLPSYRKEGKNAGRALSIIMLTKTETQR